MLSRKLLGIVTAFYVGNLKIGFKSDYLCCQRTIMCQIHVSCLFLTNTITNDASTPQSTITSQDL